MIDTAEISARAGEPGTVIRNEDVFLDKVRERVALAGAVGHLLSPVLLLQTVTGAALRTLLVDAVAAAGPARVADTDGAGRTHEIWTVGPGALQDRLLALASGGELVVADGNHRTLAAQTAGLRRFLAVVTSPDSVTIDPYNRLVSEVPSGLPELLAGLTAVGAEVTPIPGRPGVPVQRGIVHLYSRAGAFVVRLPTDPAAEAVDNLDHALVERCLFGRVLGIDPGDKRVSYVGGDYPPEWLCDEVAGGRAELAVIISPVAVDDFVAVNLARRKMPRKSTWFTPKARAGLVLADLSAEA
jgi:uncharacterized protein (DUF1015 family)